MAAERECEREVEAQLELVDVERRPARRRVLIGKRLQQVALDAGAWANAVHLVPARDPFQTEDFGGDPYELEQVQRYQRGVKDLKLGLKTDKNKEDDDEKWEVRATGAVEVRRKPADPEVGRKRRRGSD